MARQAVNVANAILMKRSQRAGMSDVLVEGVDDKTFFSRHLDLASCRVTVAFGRPTLLEIAAILEQRGFRGHVGIADADHCVLEGNVPSSPNIVITDFHDLEMMLVASPALDHLIAELGDDSARLKFEVSTGKSSREHVLALASVVGLFRLLSSRHRWALRFDNVDFERFLNASTFELDREALGEYLRQKQSSPTPCPSPSEMLAAVAAEEKHGHNVYHLCCGHDVVAILAIGLRKNLGRRRPAEVKPGDLEQKLRLAYESGYFHSTRLYASLQQWEARNPPFRVLPA
jgi:Protein of unknown function (DUF4435)